MVLVTKKILYYKNSVVLTVLHLLVSRNLIDVRFNLFSSTQCLYKRFI